MSKPAIKDDIIMGKIKARLAAIETGDDYYTTFAGVFDNKSTKFQSDELPGINLRDISGELVEDQPAGGDDLQDVSMTVEISIIASGTTDAGNIRKMKADVMKAIKSDLTWDGEAWHTTWESWIRDKVDQEGNKIADAQININVFYRQNAWCDNG